MPQTFPTRMISVVDIPEPKDIKGSFQYNFFTTDERTNDSGEGFRTRAVRPRNVIDLIDDLPRFVKITWKPVNIKKCRTSGNEFRSRRRNVGGTRRRNADIFNSKTVNLIQSEQTFSNFDFAAVNFQDSGIDGKLFNLVSGSADLRNLNAASLSDAAKSLNDFTRETVNGQLLMDAVNNFQACGVLFSDPGDRVEIERNVYEELKNLAVHTQLNNKIVGTLVRSVAEDSLNIYADEMALLVRSAEALQAAALEKLESTSVSSLEWDTGFVPIVEQRVRGNVQSFEVADVEVVGYLVEKVQIDNRGRQIRFNPILVKGNQGTSVLDPQVVYGGVYKYTVKAVCTVTLLAKNAAGKKVKVTGLVASQTPPAVFVNCTENVPPPPPADFKPSWDYSRNELRLLWSFPVNRQRDIKYFQIFRRKSINDPFEVLREFDFDDSEVPVERSEKVRDDLVFKMDDPRTYFYDPEFTKDSTFIYALCSVDAHGFTSNYSIQYQVSFDKFTNKLVIDIVSNSGAPKAYPNMFLRTKAFIDTIKTSGFERMSVYFDPEYLKVIDQSQNDLNVLPLDDTFASYKMQIINTDFQASQLLTFTLDDRRNDKDTTVSRGGRRRRRRKQRFARSLSGLRTTR